MITRLGLATFSMWKRVIGEIRNPKAENRRKAEIRSHPLPRAIPPSVFGFRVSDFTHLTR